MGGLVKNPDAIRLGVIGMTEGNGPPHSWGAIVNGYDRARMYDECPFAGTPSNFVDCVAKGVKPVKCRTVSSVENTMKLVFAEEKSVKTGRPVYV